MVVSGIPQIGNRHTPEIANMALDLLRSVSKFKVIANITSENQIDNVEM